LYLFDAAVALRLLTPVMPKVSKLKKAKQYLSGFLNLEHLRNGPEAYEREAVAVERLRQILLQNAAPHLQYSAFHVAGTKGKGSTTAFLESVVRSGGFRSGYFISPRIFAMNEQITANGREISNRQFLRLFNRFRKWSDTYDRSQPGAPGFLGRAYNSYQDKRNPVSSPRRHAKRAFDHMTAISFLHWKESEVEVAVVETGLGGLVDPTNILTEPPRIAGGFHVNVITLMGFDHSQIFGSSMAEVLRQKLGIIQPHALTVLSPQTPENAAEIKAAADKKAREVQGIGAFDCSDFIDVEVLDFGAATTARYTCDREKVLAWSAAACAVRPALIPIESLELFQALSSGLELKLSLIGRHQVNNVRTTLGAILCAAMQGLKITSKAVQQGVSTTKWPGRFEVLSTNPLIVADVAHEPLSATALGNAFRDTYGNIETIALCGFERDKDAETILRNVAEKVNFVEGVCCTSPNKPRARPAAESKPVMEAMLKVPITIADPVAPATDVAMDKLKPGQALLIFGSFYIFGTAKRAVLRRFPAADN
jgi:dihydrofolate synthase / folylpolyglutamate synthase